MRRTSRILSAAALVLASAALRANPDVWVRAGETWRLEAGTVTGLRLEWRFDPYFSDFQIRSFDTDGSRSLEPGEQARLRSAIFDPLRPQRYHVHVWEGQRERRDDFLVESFEAAVEHDRLVLRFTLGLDPPADPQAGDLVVSLHDPEVVLDFALLEEGFVRVEGSLPPGCKFKVSAGKGVSSGHSQALRLTCGG